MLALVSTWALDSSRRGRTSPLAQTCCFMRGCMAWSRQMPWMQLSMLTLVLVSFQ